jgi:hypothetical protein
MTHRLEDDDNSFGLTDLQTVWYRLPISIVFKEVVMPSLQRLESQIAALPEPELRQFRSWFDEFDAQRWDSTLAADISNGKLDSLAAEALAQYGAGQCKSL